jgi:hypothetical protein
VPVNKNASKLTRRVVHSPVRKYPAWVYPFNKGDMYRIYADMILFRTCNSFYGSSEDPEVSSYVKVMFLGICTYEDVPGVDPNVMDRDYNPECNKFLSMDNELLYSFCDYELHVTPLQDWLDKGYEE